VQLVGNVTVEVYSHCMSYVNQGNGTVNRIFYLPQKMKGTKSFFFTQQS